MYLILLIHAIRSMQLLILLTVFLLIAGSWLGFWVVRKLVLSEDGSIDVGVSHFVTWSIRIVSSVLILQVFRFFHIYKCISLTPIPSVFIFNDKWSNIYFSELCRSFVGNRCIDRWNNLLFGVRACPTTACSPVLQVSQWHMS